MDGTLVAGWEGLCQQLASAFKGKKAYTGAAGRVGPLSGLRWAFLPD